ncbi:MxaS protein, partial [Cupriavidus basilensis]
VSASMRFGARADKLQVAADFLEGLGHSAFRAGDPVGMLAFDAVERADLFVPARHSRGAGYAMSAMLRASASAGAAARAGGAEGLAQAAQRLADRRGLVFVVSDFHWALEALDGILDLLAQAYVVPMIVWDPAETEPPPGNTLLAVRDAETGRQRTLWLRKTVRAQWRDAVARRRARLDALFLARGLRPFYLHGAFEAEALSRYFLEAVA